MTTEEKRKYQREWVAKRRAKFFKDKACAKCKSTIDLELDHIDPDTKISHKIWSWSEKRRNIEIAKCQVLCHKCHKDKHMKHDYHGTMTGYKRRRCKCDLCRAWNAARMRKVRIRLRSSIGRATLS